MNSAMRPRRNFIFPLTACSFAVLIAGCSPDRTAADIGKCISKAQEEAPNSDGLTREEVRDAIGSMVGDCMKDLGYRHEMTAEKCIDDVDFNATCYVRRR